MKQFLLFFALALTAALSAQEAPQNWWDLDRTDNSYPGVSAAKTHAYLEGKKAKQGGGRRHRLRCRHRARRPEGHHLDQPGEVAGNGIDDDGNGYVDDVHGWNFIGGKDGRNVNYENLEVVRLYNTYHKKYNNRNRDGLSKAEKVEYDAYLEYKSRSTREAQ